MSKRLNLEKRMLLEKHLSAGWSCRRIAAALCVAPSTTGMRVRALRRPFIPALHAWRLELSRKDRQTADKDPAAESGWAQESPGTHAGAGAPARGI